MTEKNNPIILFDEVEKADQTSKNFQDLYFAFPDFPKEKIPLIMTACWGHCRENAPNFVRDHYSFKIKPLAKKISK